MADNFRVEITKDKALYVFQIFNADCTFIVDLTEEQLTRINEAIYSAIEE